MSAAEIGRRRISSRKQRRFALIAVALAMLGLAVGLALYALSGSIVFFRTPSEIVDGVAAPGARLRVGGLVKEGSVVRAGDTISFAITDTANEVKVAYRGIVPDLFREGQGVVAEGVLNPDHSFTADNVLAKHDERYMPREVVEALKRQGVWRDEGTSAAK
ncbi:cytochrome c-type biogenesis protein CcmE [Rhizobiales bacterium GAS191]|jgi:cytochrome c-type biogenesis protein CcmE|nr:cytochrome c-type biogenesis protein CcmE [Rhizobiales bacterium GAS113]SED96322.1 cytochrome c-type biogenesis protein CcmE [Rhizobiales bacterium GAS188]SEE56044.1 cytochrome c-type biogenesis protein CcmE [Rhizobiales bacterium GAS191]